jgi:hypothetical protein
MIRPCGKTPVMLVLGTSIHEFACCSVTFLTKLVDGRAKPDHDEVEAWYEWRCYSAGSRRSRRPSSSSVSR